MLPVTHIACVPVSEKPELGERGALAGCVCVLCGTPVWVHPNTLEDTGAASVDELPPIWCIPCALKKPIDGYAQRAKPDMKHVLRAGLAVCGLGPPLSWPSGHRWVREEDVDLMELGDCKVCYEMVKRGH